MARPVFHSDLGAFFRELREARGWSLRQTATIARNRQIRGVSYQSLQRLESGKSKNPEPELLKALAALYSVPYQQLVTRWVAHVFGVENDPARHGSDQGSDRPQGVGGQIDDAAAVGLELQELREQVAKYEKEAREVRTVWDSLGRVAFALEEIRKAPKGKTSRRGASRKTG